MSIITTIIPPQAFEVVRDRIGRILADELLAQYGMTYDTDLDVNVWIARVLPFDHTELPSVNLYLSEGSYDGQTVVQQDGTYKFNIDVFVKAPSTNEMGGDQLAMHKLHRLLGICRAIIEDARYKTLGFVTPPGFIMRRQIESIQIQSPRNKEHGAESPVIGRLVLSVKVPEISAEVVPVSATSFQTTVKLNQTDKGYLWINTNNLDPYYFYDFAVD